MINKRLIVEAVSYENNIFDEIETDKSLKQLKLLVSVSDAETGLPFTGLKAANFIFSDVGYVGVESTSLDFIKKVVERNSDIDDTTPMGIYDITLTINQDFEGQKVPVQFSKGKTFALGVRVLQIIIGGAQSSGQTVVSLVSS